MFTPRSVLLSLLAACGLLLLSATPALAADGKVAGRVTFEGKPLSGARVIFYLGNAQFVGSRTDKDGTYAVDRVPVGTHKVTIEGAGVPDRYSSEDKSSLKVEIREGKNELDFDLRR
jgi:hypothetical protein